ncbi:MAG: dienelactone hydrolase family protein [Sedimentisphaerales bacterium]|nr:dienelactone hydrolase family protein [Sedimentisphaerales bacterium]
MKTQLPSQNVKDFKKKISKTLNCKYLLFLPQDYGQETARWPMILFLHGAGERGSDINKVRHHGLAKIVTEKKDFPFIVVSPQCPQKSWWPDQTEVLISLLYDVIDRYDVDISRIYLTGLSMGGYGTWHIACRYPQIFAAIAPICGGGEPLLAAGLKDVPVWAFHGAKDPVVPVKRSKEMVDAVNACGGSAKLTIYPEAEHDSWTQTYDNPELYDWFLSHKKKKVN